MRRLTLITLILFTLSGCALLNGPPAAPTQTAAPVVVPATTNPTAVPQASATTAATAALPTPITPTAAAPVATAAPITVASPTWDGVSEVTVYLIAEQDDGKSGTKVGCGDSAIPVRRPVAQTQSPLRVAMETLLSMKDMYFGESGLYNSLYRYDLTVDDVNIRADGTAVIHLSGEFLLIGTCEDARIKAQLEMTALHFDTVDDVEITINGESLDDLTDMSGY